MRVRRDELYIIRILCQIRKYIFYILYFEMFHWKIEKIYWGELNWTKNRIDWNDERRHNPGYCLQNYLHSDCSVQLSHMRFHCLKYFYQMRIRNEKYVLSRAQQCNSPYLRDNCVHSLGHNRPVDVCIILIIMRCVVLCHW